jgi:hypothetical protein
MHNEARALDFMIGFHSGTSIVSNCPIGRTARPETSYRTGAFLIARSAGQLGKEHYIPPAFI